MKDIVTPKGNEKELAEMAERLGIKELIMISPAKIPSSSIKIIIGKEYGSKGKAEFIAAKASENARELIEGRRVDLIYDFEARGTKEFMNIRNSGMNQVIAKLMHEKKVIYGINFDTILSLEGMERARFLGRVMQNLMLCRKYKVDIFIGSFASEPYGMRNMKDLEGFIKSLSGKF